MAGLEDKVKDIEGIAKGLGWFRPPRTSEEMERYTQDVLMVLKDGQEYGFIFELDIPQFQASSVKISDFKSRVEWRAQLLAMEKAHALKRAKPFFDVLGRYGITGYIRVGSLVCARMNKEQYLAASRAETVKASYADYPTKIEEEK